MRSTIWLATCRLSFSCSASINAFLVRENTFGLQNDEQMNYFLDSLFPKIVHTPPGQSWRSIYFSLCVLSFSKFSMQPIRDGDISLCRDVDRCHGQPIIQTKFATSFRFEILTTQVMIARSLEFMSQHVTRIDFWLARRICGSLARSLAHIRRPEAIGVKGRNSCNEWMRRTCSHVQKHCAIYPKLSRLEHRTQCVYATFRCCQWSVSMLFALFKCLL